MMTRKDFILGSAGAASMVALASPVRSLLTKHGNMSEVGTSWENPYITDGLVAYFDAEWNAGGGKHSTTLGLKNLAGTEEITGFTNPSKMQMNSKSIGILKRGFSQNPFIHFPVFSKIQSQFTIEAVMHYNTYNPEGDTSELGFKNNWLTGEYYGEKKVLFRAYDSSNTLRLNNGFTISSNFGNLSMTYNGAQVSCYYNGTLKKSANLTSFPGIIGKNFMFGNNYVQGNGDFHALRVYDRALSQGEIAHNSAIDKERFGIV